MHMQAAMLIVEGGENFVQWSRQNAVTSVANNARMESCGFGSKGVHHGAGGGKLFEDLVPK